MAGFVTGSRRPKGDGFCIHCRPAVLWLAVLPGRSPLGGAAMRGASEGAL